MVDGKIGIFLGQFGNTVPIYETYMIYAVICLSYPNLSPAFVYTSITGNALHNEISSQ